MDQESFRKLLHNPKVSASASPTASGSAHVRGSLLANAPAGSKKKQKTVDASQPAFKPRTLKKNKGEEYRDRATERRLGLNNDYAQVRFRVEFVLPTFAFSREGLWRRVYAWCYCGAQLTRVGYVR